MSEIQDTKEEHADESTPLQLLSPKNDDVLETPTEVKKANFWIQREPRKGDDDVHPAQELPSERDLQPQPLAQQEQITSHTDKPNAQVGAFKHSSDNSKLQVEVIPLGEIGAIRKTISEMVVEQQEQQPKQLEESKAEIGENEKSETVPDLIQYQSEPQEIQILRFEEDSSRQTTTREHPSILHPSSDQPISAETNVIVIVHRPQDDHQSVVSSNEKPASTFNQNSHKVEQKNLSQKQQQPQLKKNQKQLNGIEQSDDDDSDNDENNNKSNNIRIKIHSHEDRFTDSPLKKKERAAGFPNSSRDHEFSNNNNGGCGDEDDNDDSDNDDTKHQSNKALRMKQRYFSHIGQVKQTPKQNKDDSHLLQNPSPSVAAMRATYQHPVEEIDIAQFQSVSGAFSKENIDQSNCLSSNKLAPNGVGMKRGITSSYGVVVDLAVLKEEQKKQLKRDQFMIEFNTDPNLAVKRLQEDQNLTLPNIAEILSKAEGIRKNTLGQFFGKDKEVNQVILKEFCKVVDFKNQNIDDALRSLMAKFRLPGESQQIDRIMCAFSESYHEQNPKTFENSDTVYILAYSIMMVHTDAHSEKVEKKDKMKKAAFVERTLGAIKSKTLQAKVLGDIFDRVQAKQFECEQDTFEKAYDLLLISQNDGVGDLTKHDVKYFKSGSIFMKYGRRGSPKEKFVYLSSSEDKICWCDSKTKSNHREIMIEDIYEITIGCDTTEVMKKNKVPRQLNNLCFSLNMIGGDHGDGKRSLDLKASDEDQRNRWIRFCYSKLLGAKSSAFDLKKARFNMQAYKEEMSLLWRNLIFDQFDRYWNYETNQPLHLDKFTKYRNQRRDVNNAQNVWKNVIQKKKKQQSTRYSQVAGVDSNGRELIREYLEDLQKDKDLLFIRLWKQGLPPFVRKTLYKLSIGNKMEISPAYYELIKIQTLQFFAGSFQIQNNLLNSASLAQPDSSPSHILSKYDSLNADLSAFVEKNPIFKSNVEVIRRVLLCTLYHRQDLNYLPGMVSIAALIVNIFQDECESFIYYVNLIFGYHFKPLYTSDKNKVEYFNQFFYQSFQKEMKDLHERFEGLKLSPQNYLYGWLLSFFSDYFTDLNIVNRILDNFILEGEVYIFKAALGILKMYEIDLRFSSFAIALKYLTEPHKNVNEEFLFDTIECININKDDYTNYFNDLKKSQVKSLFHEILLEN